MEAWNEVVSTKSNYIDPPTRLFYTKEHKEEEEL
jgi:hypothetical protein